MTHTRESHEGGKQPNGTAGQALRLDELVIDIESGSLKLQRRKSLLNCWAKLLGHEPTVDHLNMPAAVGLYTQLCERDYDRSHMAHLFKTLGALWNVAAEQGLTARPPVEVNLVSVKRASRNPEFLTSLAWHFRPEGERRQCSVCGCPTRYAASEHRATAEHEGYGRRWLRRVEDRIEEIGKPWKITRKRAPTGPGAKVQEGIAKATAALASGATNEDAAKAAGASVDAMRDWQRSYPTLWKVAYDNAMQTFAEVVKMQAGTDAVLDDPEEYMRRAAAANRWAESRGESLFSENGKATLRSFFEDYYKPVCLSDAAPVTVEKYASVLSEWTLLTGNPPLAAIDNAMLARYRDCISRRRGLARGSKASNETVVGKLKHVQAVLDKAGPPGPHNRDAAGVIQNVPYVKPPKVKRKLPKIVSAEQLNTVYLATADADRPRIDGIKPPAWWRALLVFAYNTGLRRGTLFALKLADIDWKRSVIAIPPDVVKTGVGAELPLSETVMEHLRAIRTDREFLFPWPHNMTHFHKYFHRLQTSAGLEVDEHFGLHGIRRTAATVLWQESPQAAQLLLGHASLKTTQGYYVDGRVTIARAVEAMPQPEAFVSSPLCPTGASLAVE